MLSRTKQLFLRYCHQHLELRRTGRSLYNVSGRQTGHVDVIHLKRNRLEVHGWSEADKVVLRLGTGCAATKPTLERVDVAKSRQNGSSANVGFSLTIPMAGGRSHLVCQSGSEHYILELPTFSPTEIRLARLRLMPRFAFDILRALPSLARWALFSDHSARRNVKLCLSLSSEQETGAMDARLFSTQLPSRSMSMSAITIILPVYDAFDLLPEVLNRIADNTDLPWTLIIVEDCSTDDRVRPFVRQWSKEQCRVRPDRVHLIENSRNLGFIGSVNSAIEVALEQDNHVVLLNADAFVPPNWASRIILPILTHDNVATVTPMSNDAEIMNIPKICQRIDLSTGQSDQIDAVAKTFDPNLSLAEVPTGVGFCMAINIKYLRRIPKLDTAFGAGYGEEVDWCQKARQLGGRNLGLAGLFVEHKGGSSFGSDKKRELIKKNGALVSRRYPTFDSEVQDFIRHDPLTTSRLALSVAWAATCGKHSISIYVAHSLGGGAEKYLLDRIASEVIFSPAAIVLRVGGSLSWQVECHTVQGVTTGATDDFDLVKRLLSPIASKRIVYSCGVGCKDPVRLPRQILSLKAQSDSLEVLMHDFFPLTPSYSLLDSDGRFRGVPQKLYQDPAHCYRRPTGERVSLAGWRRRWAELLAAADDIVVFSQDSRRKVLDAYPDLEPAIRLRPHKLPRGVPKVKRPHSTPPVIGVLGNIAPHKGAQVVCNLSRELEESNAASLILVGNIDPSYVVAKSATVHGDYDVIDIPSLVERYKITTWFIPSVWPETFSYVTHEALATGLPVVCFDLGAQAEAADLAPNGRTIPYELSITSGGALTKAILGEFQ